MYLKIETSSFFEKLLTLIAFCHIESNLGSESLKGVNQEVPPPEKCFFENPVHVIEVKRLLVFALLLT